MFNPPYMSQFDARTGQACDKTAWRVHRYSILRSIEYLWRVQGYYLCKCFLISGLTVASANLGKPVPGCKAL